MNGWQEPNDGKRIYLITDNTKMDGFTDYIKPEDIEHLYVTYSESRVNLGIHYYRNSLYSSNLVGICRIKSVDDETLYDAEGNELLIKVVPRFNVTVVELLNYIRDDDEFDRYMAPQTISNRHKEKDIEAIDRNEIFYFFENEKPLKVDDGISSENSIITVTVFLTLLRLLCRRPLMGRMLKEEENLTGKVKGKIVIEKNIRSNTMHGRNDRFYCQYLRFSDDIIENQILKAALRKAKRFIVDYFGDYSKDNNNYASMISYCSNALRHISDIQCSGTACNGLKFSGCYTYYKPVMAMARMVLDDISVESNGEISTTGYIVPYAISMEKLFYELYMPIEGNSRFSNDRGAFKYIDNLNSSVGYDVVYARQVLEDLKPLVNDYIKFTNDEPKEHSRLIFQIATYLDALYQNGYINSSIPNLFLFREISLLLEDKNRYTEKCG